MSRLEKKTWWNTLKFEQMAHEMFEDKAIPWIASSKSSNQKYDLTWTNIFDESSTLTNNLIMLETLNVYQGKVACLCYG